MIFKELKVGEAFYFAERFVREYWGPWRKISPRCYKPDTNPFSDDPEERHQHAQWITMWNEVGTINVEVQKV